MDIVFVGVPCIQIEDSDREEFEKQLDQYCDDHGVTVKLDSTEVRFKVRCCPVYMSVEFNERFFKYFCENVMWPTLHYALPNHKANWATDWDNNWEAYQQGNRLYSTRVTSCINSERDIIWIHSYEFFLLPPYIRKKWPNVIIGYFMHTPFPASEFFRIVPKRKKILHSLLSSNIIGFHTFEYVRHFLAACERILHLVFETLPGGKLGLRHNHRMVTVLINHAGINCELYKERALSSTIIEKANDLQKHYDDKMIIFTGCEKVDVVKAALLKFQAYYRFLETYGEDINYDVVMVSVLHPSSSCVEQNDYFLKEIRKEVELIKKDFGDHVIDVREQNSISFDELIALNVASNIAFIDAFWDGLNTAPFEYTACRTKDNPGALILSEFMGCSRSLSGAVRVNPWDLDMVSDSLYRALTMPKKERTVLHGQRYNYVMKNTTEKWALKFLKETAKAIKFDLGLDIVPIDFGSSVKLVGVRSNFGPLDTDDLMMSYQTCPKRVIFCDYDGTLTDNRDDGAHGPSRQLLSIMKKISADPQNIVFIVSGRSRAYLQRWFMNIENLGLAAEKGAFLRWPKRLRLYDNLEKKHDSEWEVTSDLIDKSWKDIAFEVITEFVEHTNGSTIEDKELSIVWHFEMVDPEFGRIQANELKKSLKTLLNPKKIEVVVYQSACIVEVKPLSVGKGLAVVNIMQRVLKSPASFPKSNLHNSSTSTPVSLTKQKEPLFLLSIGDDISDEEMFVALVTRAHLAENPRKTIKRELRKIKKRGSDSKRIKRKSHEHTYTCCVGMKNSAAHYYLEDYIEVMTILGSLGRSSCVDLCSSRSNSSLNSSLGHSMSPDRFESPRNSGRRNTIIMNRPDSDAISQRPIDLY